VNAAEELGSLLRERHLTIACAESCTGGLLTSLLTDVPGSSAYVKGSIVCYTNEIKERLVGVPAEIIKQYTEVSLECASEMAIGVCEAIGADIGVGITGNAGPSASAGQPVGRVFVSAAVGNVVKTSEWQFDGSRLQVKQAAAQKAMELVTAMLRSGEHGIAALKGI